MPLKPVPSTLYDEEIDFTALALQYHDFAKRLKHNCQLDFSDPESVRQLTKALLHRDFGVQIDLPDDRLCPPVPNRFNYIRFVQRLLDSTSPSFRDTHDPNRRVVGLDIGTGASVIYPLLALSQHPTWVFLATEIDDKSRSYAHRNVNLNKLSSRVKILDVEDDDKLIPSSQLANLDLGRIDILITNPPFYSTAAEMAESAKLKSRPPNSACTGAPMEMIFPGGGEVAFVTKLIHESQSPRNRNQIQWFSSMLGKLSSVAVIAEKLNELKCDNFAVTEFVQGTRTRRWCVAWSWMGLRPDESVARSVGPGVEKKWLPARTEFDFQVSVHGGSDSGTGVPDIARQIDSEIRALSDDEERGGGKVGTQWQFKPALNVGIGMSREGDVWSRKARRSRKDGSRKDRDEQMDGADEEEDDNDEAEEKEPAFVFKITVRPAAPSSSPFPSTPMGRAVATATSTARTPELSVVEAKMKQQHQLNQSQQTIKTDVTAVTVHIRWLQGHDSVLFESFCGWLRRKIR